MRASLTFFSINFWPRRCLLCKKYCVDLLVGNPQRRNSSPRFSWGPHLRLHLTHYYPKTSFGRPQLYLQRFQNTSHGSTILTEGFCKFRQSNGKSYSVIQRNIALPFFTETNRKIISFFCLFFFICLSVIFYCLLGSKWKHCRMPDCLMRRHCADWPDRWQLTLTEWNSGHWRTEYA